MTSTSRSRGSSSPKIAGPPKPRRELPNTKLKNVLYALEIIVGLPLFPFWPIFISIASKDPYYVNHYFETLWEACRTLVNAIKNRSIGRFLKYNVLMSTRFVEERLGERLGACTRCAKCCKMLQCEYLAYDKNSHEYFCSVYNTPYWIFGACGRYPVDQSDIDDYNCPGFAFPDSVEASRAVAPGGLIQIGKLR
jgi:hypothetical protein